MNYYSETTLTVNLFLYIVIKSYRGGFLKAPSLFSFHNRFNCSMLYFFTFVFAGRKETSEVDELRNNFAQWKAIDLPPPPSCLNRKGKFELGTCMNYEEASF